MLKPLLWCNYVENVCKCRMFIRYVFSVRDSSEKPTVPLSLGLNGTRTCNE